jgi:hypothetical protein
MLGGNQYREVITTVTDMLTSDSWFMISTCSGQSEVLAAEIASNDSGTRI